jgi:hypothetical protein
MVDDIASSLGRWLTHRSSRPGAVPRHHSVSERFSRKALVRPAGPLLARAYVQVFDDAGLVSQRGFDRRSLAGSGS